jgi:hypothetical protein
LEGHLPLFAPASYACDFVYKVGHDVAANHKSSALSAVKPWFVVMCATKLFFPCTFSGNFVANIFL